MLLPNLLIVTALAAASHHAPADRTRCPAAAPAPPAPVRRTSIFVRNDTAEPLTLRTGDATTRVEPGKTNAFALRPGENIVLEHAAAGLSAGAVIATADRTLSTSTVRIAPATPTGLTGKSLL